MRKRGAKRWLWTLWGLGAILPLSAPSQASLLEPTVVAESALSEVRHRGEATLHQAVNTAVLAVVAAETAQGVARRVTHPGEPSEALSDCHSRWGAELGPVLCPAMFTAEDGHHGPANVEVRLLGALWHLAGRHAATWWQSGHAAAAFVLTQVRALSQGDDAP